jgi:hypothetical protein
VILLLLLVWGVFAGWLANIILGGSSRDAQTNERLCPLLWRQGPDLCALLSGAASRKTEVENSEQRTRL